MNKHNLKVGQHIFVEHNYDRGVPTEYEISKIGRKWAEYKHPGPKTAYVVGRFNLETLAHEDSRDHVWLSLEERKHAKLLNEAWSSFRRAVLDCQRRPERAVIETITEARRLLGL